MLTVSVGENGSPCRGAWAFRGFVYVHLCVGAGQYTIVLVMRGPEKGGKFGSHIMVLRLSEQCVMSTIIVWIEWFNGGHVKCNALSVWVQA